jgi:AcrR family transcriptional regulator
MALTAEPHGEELRSPKGGTRLTARGEGKREKILGAAAQVLARTGYAGSTLAEIAALAGTHAGSLYYYFESREALVEEVLARGVHSAHAYTASAVEALPAGATSRERLTTAITAHIEFMLERSDYALAGVRAIGQVPEDIDAAVVEHQRAYGRFFAELMEAAAADGFIDGGVDLAAARMLVIGSANWTPEWFHPEGSSSAEEVAALLARMVFEGLGPTGQPRTGTGTTRSADQAGR